MRPTESGTITWRAYAECVSQGSLSWELLEGEWVDHVMWGPGLFECAGDHSFRVLFESGEVKSFAWRKSTGEICPLDRYFHPIQVIGALAAPVARVLVELELEEAERRRQAEKTQYLNTQLAQYEQYYRAWLDPLEQAGTDQIGIRFAQPAFEHDDIQLALHWAEKEEIAEAYARHGRACLVRQPYDHDYRLGQMLSARGAEKVAACFYIQYGYHVADLSIGQLKEPDSPDWLHGDLAIDGLILDVKNARRSKKNRAAYVEHCVSRFKETTQRKDVVIVGVLSPYLWPCHILEPEEAARGVATDVMVLGQVTRATLLSLKSEFERPGLLHFDLRDAPHVGGKFLPPWVFDYPSELYEHRSKTLNRIKTGPSPSLSFGLALAAEKQKNLLPLLLAAGAKMVPARGATGLAPWQQAFASLVENWIDRVGPSLPYLYCSILLHFVQMVSRRSRVSEYSPNDYAGLIYVDETQRDRPLFIYDPLRTINSLIHVLDTLWRSDRANISDYRVFRLQGLNILRAKRNTDDQRWDTLVAYCGGRGCGRIPLVVGEMELCGECRMLICPDCGLCSQSCARFQSAQGESDFPQGDTADDAWDIKMSPAE